MTNLGVVRLSEVKGAEQTGPVRQRQDITRKFGELGVPENQITWAEDLDVSAFHVPPLKRPGLRRALDGLEPGSTIVFYRLDRFVRRAYPDFARMLEFAAGHGHTLVSATEPLSFDTALGQMMATNIAFIGQMESENTSRRVTSTQHHLRLNGRWTGGLVPYGYTPVRVPGKAGWYLEPDETAEILRDVVARVTGGMSVNHAARMLNDAGVMVPVDRVRAIEDMMNPDRPPRGRLCECGHDEHYDTCEQTHKCRHRKRVDGKNLKLHEADECSQDCPEFRPRRWIRASVYEILRSPALTGTTVEHGTVLRNDNGMPVRFAEGVIDDDTFADLQAALDGRAGKKTRTMTPSALLGIAVCNCGQPLYLNHKSGRRKSGKTFEYTYYTPKLPCRCGSRKIPAEILDGIVERAVLREIGGFEVLRKTAGRNAARDAELRQVGRQIADLTTDQFVRGRPRADYAETMARLEARHAELSAMTGVTGDELVPTGQTFRKRWESMTPAERRLWLLDAGVRAVAVRGVDPVWTMPSARAEGDLAAIAGDVPRFIIEDEDDIHVRVMLGGMAGLLRKIPSEG